MANTCNLSFQLYFEHCKFKKKIVLNENYLTNEFSVSTDRGTSLGLIYVGKLEYVP